MRGPARRLQELKNAEEAGLKVMTIAEAAKWGDIVMMLINDEVQADVYKKDIAPNLEDGNALAFAHGFNIRYQQIVPPKGVDVFMAAPKGPRPHCPLHLCERQGCALPGGRGAERHGLMR